MLNTYEVKFELNLCAEKEKTVTVKAHTEKKAIEMAEESLSKDPSIFHILYQSCKKK